MQSKILITGATGGVGRRSPSSVPAGAGISSSPTCSKSGCLLLATGLQNAYGVSVMTYACDLTDVASRDGLFAALQSAGLTFRG
jgi:short-subunit dehydrogenase